MVLSWFDARDARAFGISLAHFFIQRSPLDSAAVNKKVTAKKQEELLNKLSRQVVQFKLEHKMNIYKKAKLGNAFKWTLMDAGYDSAYVDELTSWVLLRC